MLYPASDIDWRFNFPAPNTFLAAPLFTLDVSLCLPCPYFFFLLLVSLFQLLRRKALPVETGLHPERSRLIQHLVTSEVAGLAHMSRGFQLRSQSPVQAIMAKISVSSDLEEENPCAFTLALGVARIRSLEYQFTSGHLLNA